MKIADFLVLMINPHPTFVFRKWFASLDEEWRGKRSVCRIVDNEGPTQQQPHHDAPKEDNANTKNAFHKILSLVSSGPLFYCHR